MGFKPISTPIRDIFWIEAAAILECRTALNNRHTHLAAIFADIP